MDPQLRQFSQAIIQGATQQGPTSSVPELSKYFAADSRKGLMDSASSGGTAAIQQRADDEKRAAEAARQAKIKALEDQMDPNKYKQVKSKDGGYDFFDPSGKAIDISTYAQRTGQDRASVLKDSDNPIDREFVNDYGNMNDLMQAVHNGDQSTVDSFKTQNPQLGSAKPDDLMKQLINKYPHMFGGGTYKQTYDNRNARVFGNNGMGAAGGGLTSLGQ